MNCSFLRLLVAARDTYNVFRVRSISDQSGPCFQYLTDLSARFVYFPSFSPFFLYSSDFFFLSFCLDANMKCFLSHCYLLRLLTASLPLAHFPFSVPFLFTCTTRENRGYTHSAAGHNTKKLTHKLYNDEINLLQL